MTQTELIENFKDQQKTTLENIKQLESQLLQQKELYIKLQGAIEGIELLNSDGKTENPEPSNDNSELVQLAMG